MVRKDFSTAELIPRYLTALGAAVVTGAISTLVATRFLTPDGNQQAGSASLIGEAVALAVLVVIAFFGARRAEAHTIERIVRLVLWTTFVVAAVPGLIWFVLWLSGGSVQALLGLAAVVVGGLPLLSAYRWRRALPAVSACCLIVGVTMLLWQRLFRLLPVTLPVAVGWALVLALLGYAAGRRAENVVPSN